MISRPIVRPDHLAPKVVIVDGQPGCGKTMLSPIIAALDRVELLTYAYELEYICSLYSLGKITDDASTVMARMLTDLQLYNTMMSREVNFRFSDLSSIWRDSHPSRYLRRLFQKGDEAVPAQIQQSKPILHLTTHNLLPIAEPVLNGLKERLVIIEVVRHPLYMIKQQALNFENLIGHARDFTIYFDYKGQQMPFYARGWEEQFISSSAVEKTIFAMHYLGRQAEEIRRLYSKQVITIPFEDFVLNPWKYMEDISKALETQVTTATRAMMKKQKVPRTKIADGPALSIYKRCGWAPPKAGADEKQELQERRAWVASKVSSKAMAVVDQLSNTYEQHYMKN